MPLAPLHLPFQMREDRARLRPVSGNLIPSHDPPWNRHRRNRHQRRPRQHRHRRASRRARPLRHATTIAPNAVADVIEQIAKHFNYQGPAGVTLSAVVKDGVIYTAANVDKSWIGTNAGELFSQHVGGRVEVVNDRRCRGRGRDAIRRGNRAQGRGHHAHACTGIGSAIFLDGKLVPNTEFGHLKIRGKDAERPRLREGARGQEALVEKVGRGVSARCSTRWKSFSRRTCSSSAAA